MTAVALGHSVNALTGRDLIKSPASPIWEVDDWDHDWEAIGSCCRVREGDRLFHSIRSAIDDEITDIR